MNYWVAAGIVLVVIVVLGMLGNSRRRRNGDGVPLETDNRSQARDENLLRQRSRGARF